MSDGRPPAELVDAPVHDAWLSDAVRAAGRPSGDAAEAVLGLRLAQRVERVAQACRIEATHASGRKTGVVVLIKYAYSARI